MEYDDKVVREICYDCGSPSMRRTYAYFRAALFRNGRDVVAEVLDGEGFYFAVLSKTHGRLVGLAVRRSAQCRGIGRKLLLRCLSQLKRRGLYKLSFRTPIAEDAQYFWAHEGARIVGVKKDDYEMEITFN